MHVLFFFFVVLHAQPTPTPSPQESFTPIPSPTPTPVDLGGGHHYLPPDVAQHLSTHELLQAWDYTFSYQQCQCDINSTDPDYETRCPDGPGDPNVPPFNRSSCSYYTRMGGTSQSHAFSTSMGGLSDTAWRYPDVSYLAEESIRYQDYTSEGFPSYESRGKPVPPEVYDDMFGVQVVTEVPGRVRVIMDKPMVRWHLASHGIAVPWEYVVKVIVPVDRVSVHLMQAPNPSPSPSPSPSVDEGGDEAFSVPIPPAPLYHWELDPGTHANTPKAMVAPGLTHTFSSPLCNASSLLSECQKKAIKTTPQGKSPSLKCVLNENVESDLPKEILSVELEVKTAQCRVHNVNGNPRLVQKMVVLGDFGETIQGTNAPRLREIVIPNIYTTTPINYVPPPPPPPVNTDPPVPSPTPTPNIPLFSPSPVPSPTPINPFHFPHEEMTDKRVFTQYDDGDPDAEMLWRVILGNSLAQPVEEALDAMFPAVDGGGIIVCTTEESLDDCCATSPCENEIPTTADGYGFWFYLNPTVMNWFVGTHGGSESAGTPSQLGVEATTILSLLEQKMDDGFFFEPGQGQAGVLPDICNGDVQVAQDAAEAQAGILAGRYDDSRPFVYTHDFHQWIVDHLLPVLPGVCALAEGMVESQSGNTASRLNSHHEGVSHISGQDWYPADFISDMQDSINPSLSGLVSSFINSHLAHRPLFSREKANWFVDGPYLYHRITDGDVARALDASTSYEGPGAGWGSTHSLDEVIAAIEANSIVHFMVDVSDRLLNYVSSTSNAYFTDTGRCYARFNQDFEEGDVKGFIRVRVCVPDFGGDEQGGLVYYNMDFNCTEGMTITNGTNQTTPGMVAGECKDVDTDFYIFSEALLDYMLGDSDNSSSPSHDSYADVNYSTACTIELVDDVTNVLYDTTFVSCAADYQTLCEQWHICVPDESLRHRIVLIVEATLFFAFLAGTYCMVRTRREREEIDGAERGSINEIRIEENDMPVI